jgi:polyhydroxybutyrate depolymerase
MHRLSWIVSIVALAMASTTAAVAAADLEQASIEPKPAVNVLPLAYTGENRSIVSTGITRPFVLAYPASPASTQGLPLVFSLHGDGGNGTGMRAALPLEAQATRGAVFVYPSAPGGTFEYYTYDGRTREVTFVRDVIAALRAEFGIDTSRVFIAGFSGGATMANALGCRLGAGAIRGVGIHSGSLYPIDGPGGIPDFTYTGNGGVSCALPAAIMLWGASDNSPDVSFQIGQGVRDNYIATQNCANTTQPFTPSPCVAYDTCSRAMLWCAIPSLGHAIWSNAANAMWRFFDDALFSNGVD